VHDSCIIDYSFACIINMVTWCVWSIYVCMYVREVN
jgi:hypothetical protein